MQKLLATLKRQGVVARVAEHNPGAFVAELAPIRALFEQSPRSRSRSPREEPSDPAVLASLDEAMRAELRLLAEYSLTQLGVPVEDGFLRDEMARQFSILVRGIGRDETDREGRLRFLINASRAAFEDDV